MKDQDKQLWELLHDVTFCNSKKELLLVKEQIRKMVKEHIKRIDKEGIADIRNDTTSLYLREISKIYHDKEKEFNSDKIQGRLVWASVLMVLVTAMSIIVNIVLSQR